MSKKIKEDEQINTNIERDKKIKANISKYKKIFKNIDNDKKVFIEKLYVEAAFMEVTLSDLQEQIKKAGAVFVAKNGNGFDITQEHPAQGSYNRMIKNYNTIMKTLIEYIPEEQDTDELLQFLNKGK